MQPAFLLALAAASTAQAGFIRGLKEEQEQATYECKPDGIAEHAAFAPMCTETFGCPTAYCNKIVKQESSDPCRPDGKPGHEAWANLCTTAQGCPLDYCINASYAGCRPDGKEEHKPWAALCVDGLMCPKEYCILVSNSSIGPTGLPKPPASPIAIPPPGSAGIGPQGPSPASGGSSIVGPGVSRPSRDPAPVAPPSNPGVPPQAPHAASEDTCQPDGKPEHAPWAALCTSKQGCPPAYCVNTVGSSATGSCRPDGKEEHKPWASLCVDYPHRCPKEYCISVDEETAPAPVEKPAVETPVEKPAVETPVEKPAVETPVEKPAKEEQANTSGGLLKTGWATAYGDYEEGLKPVSSGLTFMTKEQYKNHIDFKYSTAICTEKAVELAGACMEVSCVDKPEGEDKSTPNMKCLGGAKTTVKVIDMLGAGAENSCNADPVHWYDLNVVPFGEIGTDGAPMSGAMNIHTRAVSCNKIVEGGILVGAPEGQCDPWNPPFTFGNVGGAGALHSVKVSFDGGKAWIPYKRNVSNGSRWDSAGSGGNGRDAAAVSFDLTACALDKLPDACEPGDNLTIIDALPANWCAKNGNACAEFLTSLSKNF